MKNPEVEFSKYLWSIIFDYSISVGIERREILTLVLLTIIGSPITNSNTKWTIEKE
jgi:hypothetical protein